MLSFSSNSPREMPVRQCQKPFFCKTQRFFSIVVAHVAVFLSPLSPHNHVFAGASASNWVVVVNGQSTNSRTIANYYCSARNFPGRNVIVLPNVPDADQITVDQFRELILAPVLKEIEARGLAGHIQGIAYSADFPTAIAIGSDIDAVSKKSPYLTPVGSINGLTYLFRFVLAKSPNYIGFESNLYAARPANKLLEPITSTPEQTQQLKELMDQSKHKEAATLLDALCAEFDKNQAYPMQYLAARQWAFAGDAKQATRRIEQAIQGGWAYRDYLLQDPAFATLLEDKDFIRISKRCTELPFDYLATRGFDARTFYSANTLGGNNPKLGVSYMLSMVLAVTRDLGITPFEARKNLKTSFQADYSQPTGSFIFTKTDDVRTKTREPNFAMAIKKLEERGMKARIVEKVLPPRGELCSGVMIGGPDFSWNDSGSKLLPGSIAENLTSLGGAMTTTSQTKATEFLRFGAAASSGAVTEPFTIPNKFPHPMIHVHYVDGLTTAEAFYSSVLCPYQLLIVGDPLCQPYCKPPRFTIETKSDALSHNQPLVVSLQAEDSSLTTEPEILQWIVNGVLRNQTLYNTQISMRFEKSEPGAHEIRLLVKSAKPMEQHYEQAFWVTLGDSTQQLVVDAPQVWNLRSDKPLNISVKSSPESGDIKIVHCFEEVGTIPQGKSSIDLSPTKVGYGPVRLHAEQRLANGQTVRSLPIVVMVDP